MRGRVSEQGYFWKQQVEWNSKGCLMSREISAYVFHLNVIHLWRRETALVFQNTSPREERITLFHQKT